MRVILCVATLASAVAFMSAPLWAEQQDAPGVELVQGPDGPSGRYARTPGVVEFFELTRLEAEGRPDEALAAYRQYVEKHGDQPVAHYYIARLLLRKGDREGALKAIEKADSVQPG